MSTPGAGAGATGLATGLATAAGATGRATASAGSTTTASATVGLELTRLSLLDKSGAVILDCYIKPDLPILDYR